MKMTFYLRMLMFALVIFGGCKNDNTVYTSYEPRKVVPKYLIRITHITDLGNDYTDLLYDNQKRLATIKTGTRLTINYTYNTATVASIDVRAVEGVDVLNNVYRFTYDADILKSTNQKTYVNNVLTQEQNYTHEVTRGLVMRSVITPGGATTQYTFADGNVASFSSNNSTVNYIYDGQKSPYFNLPTGVPLPGDYADRYSKNNVIKAVYPNGNTIIYTYTYDVDGYPIALLVGQDKYTFAYVTL